MTDWSAIPVVPRILAADDVKTPRPALSPSVAKTLIARSPAHAWTEHDMLGGQRTDSTPGQDLGSAIHVLLLGKGRAIAPVNADSWRSAAARAERDVARRSGLIPMLAREANAAQSAVDAIVPQLADLGIDFASGDSEVKIEWGEGPDSTVLCRGILDWHSGARILDIKTCRSAHPDALAKQVYELGWDIQGAAYRRALKAMHPELAGATTFALVCVETEPPYAVVLAELDGLYRAIGDHRWTQAVARWKECLREDFWPAYSAEPVRLAPPAWIVNKEGL